MAENHGIVSFFSAGLAIQINDDEISLDRAGVKSLPVRFQWFAESDGISQNQVNFFLTRFFMAACFFSVFNKASNLLPSFAIRTSRIVHKTVQHRSESVRKKSAQSGNRPESGHVENQHGRIGGPVREAFFLRIFRVNRPHPAYFIQQAL